MRIHKMNETSRALAQTTASSDRANLASRRKPFLPPTLRPYGTLVIQAGSINLWEKK